VDDAATSVPHRSSGRFAALSIDRASNGERVANVRSDVSVSYDERCLNLVFVNHGAAIQSNSFRQCNDPLYQQSVVEVFIAPAVAGPRPLPPTQYLEVQVSPQNVLFVAEVENPDRKGSVNRLRFVDCDRSGIQHTTTQAPSEWRAQLAIPFSLIGGPGTSGASYRANVFRIQKRDEVDRCTPATCHYMAWRPTFVVPPAFHVTERFGELVLE